MKISDFHVGDMVYLTSFEGELIDTATVTKVGRKYVYVGKLHYCCWANDNCLFIHSYYNRKGPTRRPCRLYPDRIRMYEDQKKQNLFFLIKGAFDEWQIDQFTPDQIDGIYDILLSKPGTKRLLEQERERQDQEGGYFERLRRHDG